jgi:hypothetical protein
VPVSFLSLVVVAGLVAPARGEPEPPPVEPPPEAASPLDGRSPPHRPATRRASPVRPRPTATTLPPDGALPLDGPSPGHRQPPTAPLPHEGVEPLEELPTTAGPATFELPLGMGPAPKPAQPPDPATIRLVRIDFMFGPVWRIRPVDVAFGTSVEFGRMHGFSGSFHTEMLLVTDRGLVRSFDFPIGVGVIARGQLRSRDKRRNRPLYGSVGLTVGMLVHRAKVEDELIHRVDPDFRLPIRLAWTVAGIGASVAVVPGYSVRERVYERRGAEVLNRHSVRIGLMVGLHWDVTAGRAKARRYDRRRDGRH